MLFRSLAKRLLHAYFSEKDASLSLDDYKEGDKKVPYRVLDKVWKGSELAGLEYEQLMPWVKASNNAFKVISADFVTVEDGTGIVHIAPTFGADDARVGKEHGEPGLTLLSKDGNKRPMVDLSGKYFKLDELDDKFVEENINTELYSKYAGRFVKNSYDEELTEKDDTLDVDLSVMLKLENRAFRIERQVHNYPHCWRTDKPILYYPLDSWFIKIGRAHV